MDAERMEPGGESGPPPGLLKRLGRGLLDLLCPRRCLLCGAFFQPDDPPGFCEVCRADMPAMPESRCVHCGRPFDMFVPSTHRCARCLSRPPAYDQALAPGLYEAGLRLAVHRFKYSGRTEMAGPLAAFMANRLGPPYYPPGADLVLPVPLHRRRLRQRGFNQALLLARALYRPWPALVCQDLLVRTRWTEPQVRLKGAERARNVSRAFAVADESRIRGKAVILLDDVYTTGATAGECARTLKRAGATRVLVLTLARVA